MTLSAALGSVKHDLLRDSRGAHSGGVAPAAALGRPLGSGRSQRQSCTLWHDPWNVSVLGMSVRRFRDVHDDGRVVPSWVAPAFLAAAVLMAPWILILFMTLPEDYTAAHWRLAWGGFDVGLGTALAATAVLVLRRSPATQTAAAITGALLLCDAWFDILTSQGHEVVYAVLLAVFVEVPTALLCFWIARGVERVFEDARPYLLAEGFRIRNRRLVPPPNATVPKTKPDSEP
jgi:hypothetical protein